MLVILLLNTKLNIIKIESGIKAKIIVNTNHWAICFFNVPILSFVKIKYIIAQKVYDAKIVTIKSYAKIQTQS